MLVVAGFVIVVYLGSVLMVGVSNDLHPRLMRLVIMLTANWAALWFSIVVHATGHQDSAFYPYAFGFITSLSGGWLLITLVIESLADDGEINEYYRNH